jgi:hypothetical protein
MHRRAFLQLATAAAAGLVLDPERALWVPGRKTIFLPPAPRVWTAMDLGLRKGDVITIEGHYETNPRGHRELRRYVVVSVEQSIPEPRPEFGHVTLVGRGTVVLGPLAAPIMPVKPEYWYDRPRYRDPATEVARRRERDDAMWARRRIAPSA